MDSTVVLAATDYLKAARELRSGSYWPLLMFTSANMFLWHIDAFNRDEDPVKSEVTTHDDIKHKTHDEIMEELDQLHRRCGLKTVAVNSVVLDKGHPDYQHYVDTEPELALPVIRSG